MPEESAKIHSRGDIVSANDVSSELLWKIRQMNDPAALFRLCLKGGKPLLQKRPNLPRRILQLAENSESQERADRARTGVARNFPESLDQRDLEWLQRLGLRGKEIQVIRNVIATEDINHQRRISLIRRLCELKYFKSESAALDEFASTSTNSQEYQIAHYRALILDRRVSDAQDLLMRFKETLGEEKFREVFRGQAGLFADGNTGFEEFPELPAAERSAATAAHRLNEIARSLDAGINEEIEGWRPLEAGIIYRRGASDTALIVYPGPQSVKNAEAMTRVIEECNRLGIGQVCLHRRLDRHLTGIGPWNGRPEATIWLLTEALHSVGIRRIATVGASGTSLAATIAAAEIDAAGVLLLPAVTHFPDPAKEPNERAARSAARELLHLPPGEYDARPFLQGKTVPVWAHLPEKSDFDRRQIDHLADYPYLHVVAHDFEAHGILPWLAQQELLEPAVLDFFVNIGWIDR